VAAALAADRDLGDIHVSATDLRWTSPRSRDRAIHD
jgi:hypothetical protein